MAKKKVSPPSDTGSGLQFTVDLGKIELTDEEVGNLRNEIARLAVEAARKQVGSVLKKGKEPFIKILHVKALPHAKTIRQ